MMDRAHGGQVSQDSGELVHPPGDLVGAWVSTAGGAFLVTCCVGRDPNLRLMG